MSIAKERPTCISVVICDDIYRDEQTKKLIIVGTFNQISAPAVPARHARMCVLITLTGGRGEHEMTVAIEHAETGERSTEVSGPLELENPLLICDLNLTLNGAVFPAYGKYWLDVLVDGELIGQRPFQVVPAEEQS
jgi:hypothetical protein